MLRVFYYQWTDGTTKIVCVRGVTAGKNSKIWRCNTSDWIVPGTITNEDNKVNTADEEDNNE